METDPSGLGILSEAECLERMKASQVGRLAVVVDERPLVFPVNYVLDAGRIVVRSDQGTLLRGASFRFVAFEIDGYDAEGRSGWSVMVQGMGHDITDNIDETSEHLQTVQVVPWAPGAKLHLLRIDPDTITGRQFGPEAG